MNKIGKISTILLWVLVVISAIMIFLLMSNLDSDLTDITMARWINVAINWAYILLAATAIVAIIFGIISTFSSARAAKRGLISIGFLVILLVISYVIAGDTIPEFPGAARMIREGTLTANIAKMIEAGLYATYGLLALVVLSIIGFTVARMFK